MPQLRSVRGYIGFMTAKVAPQTIARLRLAAQGIHPTSISPVQGPVDVVRSMTALQGQDFPGVLWSIGLRSSHATRAHVEAAFNGGELVRSWPMRGTLHVTLAEDLGWLLSLTGKRTAVGLVSRHRELGITAPDVEQARASALALLGQSGGKATRGELFAAFEHAAQPTGKQRGSHLLFMLCLQGTLVQGPINTKDGKSTAQYFVDSGRWIKHPRTLEREQALGELALRYFRSHGPATMKDFQWWTKLTLRDIQAGMALVRNQLESVECQGAIYWLAPEIAGLLGGTVPGARSVSLLPGFDEYLLGYTDRSAALAPQHAPRIVPGGNGMFMATIAAGGKIAGTWRKAQGAAEKSRQRAGVVLPEPFERLSPAQDKALDKAAAAYAQFLVHGH